MTNQERAIEAKKIIGDKQLQHINNFELDNAYYMIYGERLKRFCFSSRMNAHYMILKFIKAHG